MKKHLKHGLLLLFTLIFSAFALAQHRPPSTGSSADQTLRVAVDLVMLDVSATDENGRFVKDLGKDSFKIYEDKVEQGSPHSDLRALVYMIRCAFAHDMMRPVWHARGPFARPLRIDVPSGPLTINMSLLHGQPFSDADIGGIESYFEIKNEVERIIRETGEPGGAKSS